MTHVVRVVVRHPGAGEEPLLGEGIRTNAPLVPPGEVLVLHGEQYRVQAIRQELMGYGSVDAWASVTTYQVVRVEDVGGVRELARPAPAHVPPGLLEAVDQDAA
jgi:hypothetical protein